MNTMVEERQTPNQPKNATLTKDNWFGGVFLLLVVLGISILIYSTFSWMTDEQRLPLSQLMIEGDLEHISSNDIQTALTSLPHIGTFMTQDVNELQQALKKVPWVAQVSIRKQWPNLIKVYIVEHKAVAIWNGNALLNEDGNVFDASPSDASEVSVNLYGPKGSSEKVLQAWQESAPKLLNIGRIITSVVLNERQAWQIILDNGIRLELGKDAREDRLNRLIKLYSRLGDKTEQISYIDLRYDTGAAIGWISDEDSEQERSK